MSAKKKIKTGSLIFYIVLSAVVVFSLYLIICGATNRVPMLFGSGIIRISTESMDPTIEPNSFCLIQSVSAEDVAEGDIITFYSDDPAIKGKPNTHRVVEIIKGDDGVIAFKTKGDNNPGEDKVNADGSKLIGRFVCNLPVLTVIFRVITLPYVYLPLLVIVALISVLAFINDIKKAKNLERDRLVAEEVERLKRENAADNENKND